MAKAAAAAATAKQVVDVTALRTLVEASIELGLKQQQLIEEMQAIVNGRQGIGARMRIVSDGFLAAWARRYRSKYVWHATVDSTAAKRLLQRLEPEDLLLRIGRFIAAGDEFYLQHRHPFSAFARDVNRFADGAAGELFDVAAGAIDCTHVPRCTDDAMHTRRKLKDLRS